MQYTPAEIANEIFIYSQNRGEFIQSQFKLRTMIYLMDVMWEETHEQHLIDEPPKFRNGCLFPYYEGLKYFGCFGSMSITSNPYDEISKDKRDMSHDVIHFVWSICELAWDKDQYYLMQCLNAYKSSKMTEINRNEGD